MSKNYKKPTKDSEDTDIKRSGSSRKQRNGNRKRSGQERSKTTSNSIANNEASWYAATPQLMKDSASLPYSYATGTKIPMSYSEINYLGRKQKPASVPGIMKINLIPSVGISTSAVSPVNIAARKIYAWVRHANSGSVNYDAPDLMIYLLAMDSCFSFYSYLMRAIGFVHTYSQRNRYLSKDLIKYGMNIDADDLIDNLANYRYRLNVLASKLASLAVPNTMSYFMRHASIYQNVFLDAPTEKAQLYVHTPELLYKFAPYTDKRGGILVPKTIDSGNPQKMDTLIDLFDSMMAAVIVDEDMNIMSGDIIKAYGDSLIKIGTIAEDLIIYPIFDASVLTQIQNTTLVGMTSTNSLLITQETDGSLLYNPTFVNPGNVTIGDRNAYLNMPIDDVSPEQSMIASRLLNIPYTVEGSPSEFKLNYAGSEIATKAHVYTYGESSGSFAIERSETITAFRTLDMSANGQSAISPYLQSFNIIRLLTQLQQFSMHPNIRLGIKVDDGPDVVTRYISDFISLDNYTVIDEVVLSRMHETALLSEFDVYGVGRA